MLVLAPERVAMTSAKKDYTPGGGQGVLTRDPKGPGTYSPTGSWGDPTLASRAKGRAAVHAILSAVVDDIEALCAAPLG